MRIRNLTPFPVGYVTTSRRPPQPEMTVVVRGAFTLRPGHPVAVAEDPPFVAQGHLTSEVYAEGDEDRRGECLYPSDFADFKLRTDLLLRGTCHPPRGEPVTECPVKLSVGAWSKTLRVIGPRAWSDRRSGAVMSRPLPFTRMPLDYAHAFGGPGYAKNPAGKGHDANDLPNVELADPIRSPGDRPEPAGFGPISAAWPQRAGKVGEAYGKSWIEKNAPYYAEDFDWTYFNAAPEDQQLPGYLRGDEEIAFHNLHPDAPAFSARLPGLRVRVFVKDDERRVREVRMSLDTLLADLDKEILFLTWRGVDPVREDDLADVRWLLVASEPLGDAKDEAHYAALLEEIEKDPLRRKEHLPEGLREQADALAPRAARRDEAPKGEAPAAGGAAPDPISGLLGDQLAFLPRDQEEKLRRSIAEAVAKAQAAEASAAGGAASEDRLRSLPPEAQEKVRAAIASAPSSADLLGAVARPDNDVPAAGAPRAGRRPNADRGEVLRALRARIEHFKKEAAERGLTIEGVEAHEARLDDPRLAALGLGGAPPVEPGPGRDLSGRDLSREDLGGRDLRGANLERANLMGASLRGACLEGSNLKHALLVGADLTAADLSRADLSQANLSQARAEGASFSGATLTRALFVGAALGGATLAGATGESAIFTKAGLAKVDARGATFLKAMWESADLEEADFSGASLLRCLVLSCRASLAQLKGARLDGTSFGGSDLTLASFADARGEGTIWQGATLDRTDYSYAFLPRAFFFETNAARVRFFRADLREARFYRASLVEAQVVQSNLFRANLNRTALAGAKLVQTSLFDAVLARTKLEDCELLDCNLARILIDQEKRQG